MKKATSELENFPDWVIKKWQEIADVLAETIGVPAALLMKTDYEFAEVLISSQTENNPYTAGSREKLSGSFDEMVIKSQDKLVITSDATDKNRHKNPEAEFGMISYLGFPVNWPDKQSFGTLCVLDRNEREFTLQNEKLMLQFKKVIELDLALLQTFKLNSSNSESEAIHEISRQNQVIDNILKNESKFQTIIANTPDHIVVHDSELRYVMVINPQLGLTESDMIGKTDFDFLDSKDAVKLVNIKKQVLETGNSFHLETSLRNLEGDLEHFEGTFIAKQNLEGKTDGLIGYFRNVTDRKQVEGKLQKSNQLFRELINNSQSLIYFLDKEGRFIEVNRKLEKLLDPSSGSPIGKTREELFPKSIAVQHRENDLAVIRSKAAMSFEEEVVNSCGKLFYNTEKFPLLDSDGNVYALGGISTDITERKHLESIFKEIIEKNPLSIRILNIDGYTLDANSAHYKLFGGCPPPDFSVFKNDWLIQHGYTDLFEKIKMGEVVYFPDSYINVHDFDPSLPDVPQWIKTIGFALNGNNGSPERIVMMHENITERKNTEALLNDIIEKNPLSIQIVDKNGLTVRWNPAYIQLFGAIPPPDFSIFSDLESRSTELAELISHAKNGEIVHFPDLYYNAHDIVPEAPDNPLWIRALIFPLKASGGMPENFVLMHENITERKFAEQELLAAKQKAEENEEKYRQIFDNTFDIMAIYEVTEDRRFKVITFNAAEERLIGPVENYQNRYIDDCIPPELYNQFKEHYERCISEEKLIVYEEDISFMHINRTFHTQLIPLKNTAGRVHRIIVISRDITDNRMLQTQLINQNEKLKSLNLDLIKSKEKAEESDKLKSAFLANMSHEIRTPMNGILGFSELLKAPDLTGNQQQEYIDVIEKSGKRMLNIINDIIDISKIEAGLMKMDLSETNVNEQIEYIFTFFRPEMDAKGLGFAFRNSLAAKEALIKTDREKLYAILGNLVKNAIKYTEKGSIEFGYTCEGTSPEITALKFYVKDTGIGIPKNRIDAIFERFIQASVPDKIVRQGAGLGLTIAKSYVEMMGGRIWVESEEGVGSTFYFTLPYTVETKIKSNESVNDSLQVEKSDGLKLTILIAEDDEISEKLISINVRNLGNVILKARTGFETVEICRNRPDIDLILLDIQMPGLNGYEATRQIRQFNQNVIIIAQTAFGLTGDREKALEAGCNDYIAKPINKNKLVSIIKKHFV
jgi:PAS domain S-box-containing protein